MMVSSQRKRYNACAIFLQGNLIFYKQWIYFFFPLEYEGDGSRHLSLHKLDICELSLSWALEQDLAARKCVIEIHRLLGSAASGRTLLVPS